MKIYIYTLFLACTVSCIQQKEMRSELGFPETKALTFTAIDCQDVFLNPKVPIVFDSLLLVYNPIEGKNFILFNLNTLETVAEGIMQGEGPDDILYGAFSDRIGNNKFQIVDQSSQKTLVYSIDSILKNKTFIPITRDPFTRQKVESGDFLSNLYVLNDSVHIGLGAFKKGKYVCYEKGTASYHGQYPEMTDIKVPVYFLLQGILHINKDRNLILYHSAIGCYYELISAEGNQLKTVFSEFTPVSHVEDAVTNETKHGIFSADFTENEIFMLYSGRTMLDHPDDYYYSDKVLVIGQNGTKKMQYELDRNVMMISVDGIKKRIYAVAENPETKEMEIGYYAY